MSTLASMSCVPCRRGAPPLTDTEIAALRSELPDWELIAVDAIPAIERVFRLPGFTAALALANAIGDAAEAQGHHPRLVVEWGLLTVTWWTHAIKGLHQNDFIMAAKTDELYAAGWTTPGT